MLSIHDFLYEVIALNKSIYKYKQHYNLDLLNFIHEPYFEYKMWHMI